MANNSGLSKRAALKQQQELEDRHKRNARVLGFGLGAVALAVVVVLAIVIFQTLGKSQGQAENQLTPPNATADYGIEAVSHGVQPASDVPHLVIYEDFQCPACASYVQNYASPLYELVDAGKITIEYRMATFLEDRMGNDSSTRPAIAAAAADAVGKFREYHKTVYANQPAEGVGYTDQQLRVDFPAQAGITGDDLKKFQEQYDTKAYADFVKKMSEQFAKSGMTGTPSYVVNGKKLEFFDATSQQVLIQNTADDLLRAINEANK